MCARASDRPVISNTRVYVSRGLCRHPTKTRAQAALAPHPRTASLFGRKPTRHCRRTHLPRPPPQTTRLSTLARARRADLARTALRTRAVYRRSDASSTRVKHTVTSCVSWLLLKMFIVGASSSFAILATWPASDTSSAAILAAWPTPSVCRGSAAKQRNARSNQHGRLGQTTSR